MTGGGNTSTNNLNVAKWKLENIWRADNSKYYIYAVHYEDWLIINHLYFYDISKPNKEYLNSFFIISEIDILMFEYEAASN